ncbi:hypothetical protein [Streptomyces sp. NPDC048248]|uniref:hypothetical protein n=1 Tax=Streptomyces sp. NPDC048248 TaxID=3365523 RepID=UPI003722D94D
MAREWQRSFPDGEGSDPFLLKFREAVVPGKWRRSLREDVLPVLALDTAGTGTDQAAGVRAKRVLDGLEDVLSHNAGEGAKLTPYARPALPALPPPGTEYLTLKVGEQLCAATPLKGARLPGRNLRLMTDLTQELRERPETVNLGGRTLRDRAYSLRAEEAGGGVLHWLAGASAVSFNGALSWLGDLIALFGKSVLYRFPRWCWSAWWTRRLLTAKKHNWYEQWRRMGKSDHSVFYWVSELLTRQCQRLTGGDAAAAEEARQDLEELLLRALLADLRDARPGRFGPWARRRRTRSVVLLDLPAQNTPASAATARFLRALRNAARAPGNATLLVVAAGPTAAYQQADWRRCQSLQDGAGRFAPVQDGGSAPPLLIPLAEQRFEEEGIHVTRIGPRTPKPHIKPATECAVELTAVTVAAAVVFGLLTVPGSGTSDGCFDGQRLPGPHAPQPLPAAGSGQETPREQFQAVVESIRKLNDRALNAERNHRRPVRKVVYLGATVPADLEEAVDNGAIPELRGLWLAQQRLNDAAVDDPNRVRLYIDIRDAGIKFTHAVAKARQVVDEAREFKDTQDHRTIVGVVGFSESRNQTRDAVQVLDRGKVPVIGTTATADAMHRDVTYYRPMSPSNSRESRIAARFVRSERVVATGPGRCEPATRALVIKEPGDLFSTEMGSMFAREFGAGTDTLTLSASSGGVTPYDVARTVCATVKREPRTVVHWAARVRNFSAFVNHYGPDSGCAGLPLTVMGSNELTSTALRGKYRGQDWLRLYHSVHVLPENHPDSNGEADALFRLYVQAYTAKDPWLNDGHVALAHDALKVLSTATDRAYASTETADTEGVKSKLDEEISFQGASGVIDFPERNGSKPPLDKALIILRATPKGPSVALYCGAFNLNDPRATRWGPNGEHHCPIDD